MTDAELKKLNRTDLLELLLAQEKDNESLRKQLQLAKQQLEDRRIALEETGNIADASLRLNGVFQAAQDAANQYLDTIRARSEEQEAHCAALEAEAGEKADRLLQETEERCAAIRSEAEAYFANVKNEADTYAASMRAETEACCTAKIAAAEADSKAYWDEVSRRMEEFYDAHQGLRELLAAGSLKGSAAE